MLCSLPLQEAASVVLQQLHNRRSSNSLRSTSRGCQEPQNTVTKKRRIELSVWHPLTPQIQLSSCQYLVNCWCWDCWDGQDPGGGDSDSVGRAGGPLYSEGTHQSPFLPTLHELGTLQGGEYHTSYSNLFHLYVLFWNLPFVWADYTPPLLTEIQ